MLRFALVFWLLSGVLFAAPEGYKSFSLGGNQNEFLSLLSLDRRIDVWFFDAKKSGLVVLDEGNSGDRYGDLARAMKASGCTAGINGGYFAADAENSPLGLLLHNGKMLFPLAAGSFTVSGVLYDTGREIRLERTRKLSLPLSRMREAIQGGPFLVEHGRKVKGLNDTRRARRSFVATDGAGMWCVGMSSPITLDELGSLLASGRALGDFRVQTALNMDGGTSSAFWVAEPAVYRQAVKPVRNYVGVRPRVEGKKRK